MSRRHIFIPLIAFLILCLTGCLSTGGPHQNLPLSLEPANLGFISDYEIQATLQISRETIQEDYILALRTGQNDISAALLTPQGIPVYSVTVVEGRLRTQRQTAIGELLPPLTLLAYLQLIYLADDNISPLLRTDWNWQISAATRQFCAAGDQASCQRSIKIQYSGDGPWYPSALLTDSRDNTRVTIRILEASLVLPQ